MNLVNEILLLSFSDSPGPGFRNRKVLENVIQHEKANHKFQYFGIECPYKGIKFIEKVLLEDRRLD